MERKVRKGVFETNSSSTHSICITKNNDITLPKFLHFAFGEFGWEIDTLRSTEEKASYLYTAMHHNDLHDEMNNIIQKLKNLNIEVTTERPIYSTHTYTNDDGKLVSYKYTDNGGYIDHGYELMELLLSLCNDDEKLLRFLFSDLSYILTGNDNTDYDVTIDESPDIDVFYKGN